MRKNTILSATAGGVMLLGAFAYGGVGTAVADGSNDDGVVETEADLDPLNNSGARGEADVDVMNRRLDVDVQVKRVVADMPHAMHIHYGEAARNECPTAGQDDDNGDFRVNTVEGLPAYGPVKVSFTTRGPTGPGSILAVDRFPTAPNGTINYERQIKTTSNLAQAIRDGEAVVVVHGVDYNGNGAYDFDSAGESELDPSLPAEATDPAACGVLTPERSHNHSH